MFRYVISGLNVASDIALRSAVPVESSLDADLTIRLTELPDHLAPGSYPIEPAATVYRFRIDSLGKFQIQHGREIQYQPEPGVEPANLAIYLVGTCLAAALQQRGHIVLHASAVSVRGRAMLFCGASGAGKSTLAAMLGRRGYPLLNDDVCNLGRREDGVYTVSPDGRMLKLWSASLRQLERPATGAPVFRGVDKFYLAPENSDPVERPVARLYLLREAAADAPPSVSPLRLAEAMAALQDNAYRPEMIAAMHQQKTYFAACAALCQQAKMLVLSRPKDFSQADAVLDALEASWNDTD